MKYQYNTTKSNNLSRGEKIIMVHILGLGAMISLFLIYQQKNRKNIILCKLSADIFWIAHYFYLGATAGMIPNFVGILREVVFVQRGKKRWASTPLWVVLFISINLVLGFSTFQNSYDLIPIIASSFVTISLWLNNPNLTKIISIPVSIAFLVYDIFVVSYMGIINESFAILSILIYFIRKKAKK